MAVKSELETRPLIAISAVPRSLDTGYGADLGDTVAAGLVSGVLDAGGIPIVLPVVEGVLAAAQLRSVDGLVLAGGQDLALELSEEEMKSQPDPRWIDPKRDDHEFALWNAARDSGLPVLGICRGAQLITHAAGGTLIPHLGGHDAGHRHQEERHPVTVSAGSRLAEAVGAGDLEVNTIHHQAVRAPASGFEVSAVASDGSVEAVESTDPDHWVLAVQWHPELMLDTPGGQSLFGALIRRAGGD